MCCCEHLRGQMPCPWNLKEVAVCIAYAIQQASIALHWPHVVMLLTSAFAMPMEPCALSHSRTG